MRLLQLGLTIAQDPKAVRAHVANLKGDFGIGWLCAITRPLARIGGTQVPLAAACSQRRDSEPKLKTSKDASPFSCGALLELHMARSSLELICCSEVVTLAERKATQRSEQLEETQCRSKARWKCNELIS